MLPESVQCEGYSIELGWSPNRSWFVWDGERRVLTFLVHGANWAKAHHTVLPDPDFLTEWCQEEGPNDSKPDEHGFVTAGIGDRPSQRRPPRWRDTIGVKWPGHYAEFVVTPQGAGVRVQYEHVEQWPDLDTPWRVTPEDVDVLTPEEYADALRRTGADNVVGLEPVGGPFAEMTPEAIDTIIRAVLD